MSSTLTKTSVCVIIKTMLGLYSKNYKSKKGFTIIEVVLVLAIAGLIFLSVFIALPALQRSQRNTQRKNDALRLKAAFDTYKANNRGQLPWQSVSISGGTLTDAENQSFTENYMTSQGDQFEDPSGNTYVVRMESLPSTGNYSTAVRKGLGNITVRGNTKCSSGSGTTDSVDRYVGQYTIVMPIEPTRNGGSSNTLLYYCVDG